MKGFADLADLPEDDRIRIIGERAEGGEIVAFIVDDDEKADRYVMKLLAHFKVNVTQRMPWPGTPGAVLVRVTRALDS